MVRVFRSRLFKRSITMRLSRSVIVLVVMSGFWVLREYLSISLLLLAVSEVAFFILLTTFFLSLVLVEHI